MPPQICLITGATDGVGKVTARELAKKGFIVIIVARNPDKAEAVKREMLTSIPNAIVDYIIADLASLDQIRRLVTVFKQRYDHLDVLINNAGIVMSERVLTQDGYESAFQVNYLSQFFLTMLLLDELKKSKQGRIINLGSDIFTKGKFLPGDLQGEKRFSPIMAYANSKLLVFLFTTELAERIQDTGVTANIVQPGIVRTQMMFRATGLLKVITLLAYPFSVTPEKGAATSVYLATSADLATVSGKYFKNSKMAKADSKFNTPENRQLLWKISMDSLAQSIRPATRDQRV
jgi:retinol dehydrogenase-12